MDNHINILTQLLIWLWDDKSRSKYLSNKWDDLNTTQHNNIIHGMIYHYLKD